MSGGCGGTINAIAGQGLDSSVFLNYTSYGASRICGNEDVICQVQKELIKQGFDHQIADLVGEEPCTFLHCNIGNPLRAAATNQLVEWPWNNGASNSEMIANGLAGGFRGLRGFRGKSSCSSFVPGTTVLMADGTRKPIEDIEVGDKVIATDPETGKTQTKTVLATITSAGTKNLVEITVDTGDGRGGKTGLVIATDAHPFWVAGDIKRWLKAEDLKPGMRLRTSTGMYVQVSSVSTYVSLGQRVHNLTVADHHTYYVLANNTPVLVHNCNFRPGAADEHYDKHVLGLDDAGKPTRRPDMPEYNRPGGFEQYVDDACSLMCGKLPSGAREAMRGDGVIIRLDSNGRLGMRNGNDITTFFRPDDPLAYFLQEAAR